jgi:hypothetical protein
MLKNNGKIITEEKTPSNILKNGIDSIIYLFENKRNEYSKNLADYQIIIANLEKKIKKLVKENYILRKNNTRQNKLINELRSENTDLKNIINNIKGKLNKDLNATLKNSNKIKINKLNINNFGSINRTRNVSNFARIISSSSNKEMCLTDRDRDKYPRKNNVLGIKETKKRILYDKNFPFNEYINNIKDNYYTRQRSKNNSYNQYLFKNESTISSNQNSLLNKIENNNNTLETDTFITNNSNILKHLSIDYKNLPNFHTIDINDKKENIVINNNNEDKIYRKYKKNIMINDFLIRCKNCMSLKDYKDISNLFHDYRNKIFSNENVVQNIHFILKDYKELLNDFNNIKRHY